MSMKKKVRFSIIDVLIVFVVIAAFVVGIKFINAKEPGGTGILNIIGIGEKNYVHYTVEVKSVPFDYKDNYVVGERVYDSLSGSYLGDIEKVDSKSATENIADVINGVFVESVYPDKEDVYITIKAAPGISNKGFYVGGHFVKVGTNMNIQTSGCIGSGFIVDVEYDVKGGAHK